MQAIPVVGYILIGLVQLAAILAGLSDWLDLHWIVAIPVAFFVAYIPLVGSIAGVVGAVHVWDWPVWVAIVLFFWPIILFALATLLSWRLNN